VIEITFKRKRYDALVNYERDVEIDEGVQWHADGIEADPENEPYMSVYGKLNEDNEPLTEVLVVIVEEDQQGNNTHRITDVRVLEVDDSRSLASTPDEGSLGEKTSAQGKYPRTFPLRLNIVFFQLFGVAQFFFVTLHNILTDKRNYGNC